MRGQQVAKVRDTRRPGWFWINREVVTIYGARLGPDGIGVYNVLAMHADNETQVCFPSHSTIARQLGISRQTVIKKVALLKDLGLVSVRERERPGGGRSSNEYTLLAIQASGGRGSAELDPDCDVNAVDTPLSSTLTGSVSDIDGACRPGLHELDPVNEIQNDETESEWAAPQLPALVWMGSDRPSGEVEELAQLLTELLDEDVSANGRYIQAFAAMMLSEGYELKDFREFGEWWYQAGPGVEGDTPTMVDLFLEFKPDDLSWNSE